jgi:hypothetical protein
MNQLTPWKLLTPFNDDSPLFIPLALSGVTSYFPVRKPTIEEWEDDAAHPHIDLMAEESIWDPQSPYFAEMEDQMVGFKGRVVCGTPTARGQMVINSLSASSQVDAVDVMDDENFGVLLESTSCISSSISKVGMAKSKSSQWRVRRGEYLRRRQSAPFNIPPSVGLQMAYTHYCQDDLRLIIGH